MPAQKHTLQVIAQTISFYQGRALAENTETMLSNKKSLQSHSLLLCQLSILSSSDLTYAQAAMLNPLLFYKEPSILSLSHLNHACSCQQLLMRHWRINHCVFSHKCIACSLEMDLRDEMITLFQLLICSSRGLILPGEYQRWSVMPACCCYLAQIVYSKILN